jgi:hypothetical protein
MICFSHRRSIETSHLTGGGGGNSTLGGPYGLTPVFGTGDFSNSSTPPHRKNLERRRGFEPRTPSLQLGRSPLAVAAPGTPGVIRTPNGGFGIRRPHHRQPGHLGAPGRIRTSTVPLLRRLPLPLDYGRIGRPAQRAPRDSNRHWTRSERGASAGLGYEPVVFGARFELATMRLSTARVCQVAPPEHWWAVKDSNLGRFPKGYRDYSPALSASQPTAQTRIVKDLAEGRRLERLCPEGPWLSRPVGYQLPEPSRCWLKMWFKGELQT